MKTLFGIIVLTASLSVSAQSFVLQSNGVLHSIDAEAKVYDLNQFIMPMNILARGKSWILEKSQLITTVDAKGFVYKKTGMKGPKALKARGGSWFMSDKGEMNVVTLDGMYYTYDKEDLFRKGEVVVSGGNFLVIKKDNVLSMVTVDTVKGFTYTIAPAVLSSLGLNLANIKEVGGNYFVDAAGVLFTVDKTGLIGNKSSMGKFSGLKVKGSNYLVDAFGGVRVVLNNGWMLMPNLPKKMGAITKSGTTHAWDAEGEFFSFAESAPDAEVTSTNTTVFAGVLNKLIVEPAEQIDPRTIAN
jgi:hypothetical protein